MNMRRSELYQAIWSDPVYHVAKRLGVSYYTLSNACRQAEIPTPPRGHWRRLQTGQPVDATPLPEPEKDDEVEIVGASVQPVRTPEKAHTRGPERLDPATEPPMPTPAPLAAPAPVKPPQEDKLEEGEYAQLLRHAEKLDRHQKVGRLLSELTMRLPSESERVASVAGRWLAIMRRQHLISNPVDVLMAELRDAAVKEGKPDWWTV